MYDGLDWLMGWMGCYWCRVFFARSAVSALEITWCREREGEVQERD